MRFLIKDAMTQGNVYQKGVTVIKWYVRQYLELELFPEMQV